MTVVCSFTINLEVGVQFWSEYNRELRQTIWPNNVFFKVTALGQEAGRLQEIHPENAEEISAKQDEIVSAWGNLKDKVCKVYIEQVQEVLLMPQGKAKQLL